MADMTRLYSECFFQNYADFTAMASSNAEATLLAGVNRQPRIPAGFLADNKGLSKTFRLEAAGVFSDTATPTLIFQVRLGATVGSTQYGGSSLGVSAAISCGSGVSNKLWKLALDFTCTVPAVGSTNATVVCHGDVWSYGFASPFRYPLLPSTPDTATWTATFDGSVDQWLNLSATWSASSSSNTITCKHLRALLLN